MSGTRRARPAITYEGTDISGGIKSFTYTDSASGESDAISITLQDQEGRWMGAWMPERGARMSAEVAFTEWEEEGENWSLYCGEFRADDVSLSGPPASCMVGATSAPRQGDFGEKERTQGWENVTVKEIAAEIAARAGIGLHYEAGDIPIRAIEQDQEADSKFLCALCKKYGLAMKVFADKIIIFDETGYEARPPAAALQRADFESYAYNTTLAGTYTGARISYADPGTGDDLGAMAGAEGRVLELNEEADNAADAIRKAVAALNNANKKSVTLTGTIMPRKGIAAGQCVAVSGFGTPDGKYYIDKAVTKITAGGAAKQSLTMHKTGFRLGEAEISAAVPAPEPAAGETVEHVVVQGDTLWSIADKYLGSPLKYALVYAQNKEAIEDEAQARRKRDSSNGHWIFPGTVLKITLPGGGENEKK